MKTVFINGKFLCQKITGVQRYAREIVEELDKLPGAGEKYQVVCPSGHDPSFMLNHISIVVLKGRCSYYWEQIRLCHFVKKRKGYLLNLCNICPILLKKKNFSTIHDVAFIDNKKSYNWKFRLAYRFLQKRNAKRSSLIFTDSYFSKNRLIDVYSIDPAKISVVYCGVRSENESSVVPFSNSKKPSRPFYFAVGSTSPNKNLAYIYEAAKNNPNVDFYVAGGSGRAFSSVLSENPPENLHILGYIHDDELRWYYQNCDAFIFPSFYEGFGLPPLEAVACGCHRLILSDIPVLKEIYCDYANFVNPFFSENQFLACTKGLADSDREGLLLRYSWQISANKIDCVINSFFQNSHLT